VVGVAVADDGHLGPAADVDGRLDHVGRPWVDDVGLRSSAPAVVPSPSIPTTATCAMMQACMDVLSGPVVATLDAKMR
jgi:hypothetical protein